MDSVSAGNNVQFHKISIPTPRKVNGNSKGKRGLKSPNVLKESMYMK